MRATIPRTVDMKPLLHLILSLSLLSPAWADNGLSTEVLPNMDNNAANTSILNDQLRKTTQTLLSLQNSIGDINDRTTGILTTDRGGTGQDASAWTSGDFVYMSSTGVMGHKTIGTGIDVFTSSGTFTAPAGVNWVSLTILSGGGGGGAGGTTSGGGGGGGGGGGFVTGYLYPVTGGNTYTVTVGAAGIASTNGGASIFDTLSVPGGSKGADNSGGTGGTGGSAPALVANGSNGVATALGAGASEAFNLVKFSSGGNGGNGGGGSGGGGGGGGASIFGNGGSGCQGAAGGNASNASNADGYGAGGGGGCGSGGGTAGAAGTGSKGFVIVQH